MTTSGADLPRCSVVVPTHRRPGQLVACLEALSRADYSRERFEVIVVDDGGGLEADGLRQRFRGALELRLARQPRLGPAAARNVGARMARGELLVFTDDDCIPDPGWLGTLARRYLEQPNDAVGGHTANALRSNPYSTASQLIIDAGYAHYNGAVSGARFLTSNNLAVPRRAFLAVGGFDPSLWTSEDRDLCERWTNSGRRMAYEPRAVVAHVRPMTLRSFCLQHFAYGRGARGFHTRRPRGSLRRELDLGYYLALPRRALRREQGDSAFAVLLLLPVWQLANAAGFIREWWSERAARRRDRASDRPLGERLAGRRSQPVDVLAQDRGEVLVEPRIERRGRIAGGGR